MDLEAQSVEEIEAYKDGLSAQIDTLREQMQEAEAVRVRKQGLADVARMMAAAGIEGSVTITPAPATLGMKPSKIGGVE